MCCTQCKDNRPEESGPIGWEVFREAYIRKYFPCQRREVKVKVFINLK